MQRLRDHFGASEKSFDVSVYDRFKWYTELRAVDFLQCSLIWD